MSASSGSVVDAGVGVEKQDELRAAHPDALVRGSREPAVRIVHDELHLGKLGAHERGGIVAGGVVDHDGAG